ncbi:hypothetical protein D3C78_1574420 [compost metagenome]
MDGDSNCPHSVFGFANCSAVTETCNGIEFPVQRFDGIDGVGSLLAGLAEPGFKGDPQRPLPLQARQPYFTVRRRIGHDAGAHIGFKHQA